VTGPVVLACGEAESVAFTVKLAVPAVVGVPIMLQAAPSESPEGNVPDVIEQL
jgi:hypothetical protein